MNVLGALRETADDAIVWQLRGYAAKKSSGGANVGLIYRRAAGEEALVGANIFYDYEEHDYGSFSRWSLGGEVRGGWGGLFVNRYMALSDAEPLKDGRKAYSRDGFDVAAEFKVPKFRWISGGLTHYKWDGEDGDADDKGFRYHAAFGFSELMGGGDLWGGLSFEVEYDNPERGGGDWGGRISYRHAFDAPTPTGSSTAADHFDPRAHFFDPVRREYAQRITVRAAPTLVVEVLDVGVSVSGTGTVSLVFYDTVDATMTLTMTTVAAGDSIPEYQSTAVVSILTGADSVVDIAAPPRWTVRVFGNTRVLFWDEGRQLHLSQGTVHVRRNGLLQKITTPSLTIGLLGTDLTVGYPNYVDVSEGVLSISVVATVATIGEVVDLTMSSREATVLFYSPALTAAVRGVVEFSGTSFVVSVQEGRTGALAVLPPRGGYAEGYVYSVEPGGYSFAGGTLLAAGAVTGRTTLKVRVADGFSPVAEAEVVLSPYPPLTVDPLRALRVRADTAVGATLLALPVSGGVPGYRYRVDGRVVRVDENGAVLLNSAGEDGDVLTATIVVGHQVAGDEVVRHLTVSFYEGIGFDSQSASVAVAGHYVGAVYTVTASGGAGAVQYSSAAAGGGGRRHGRGRQFDGAVGQFGFGRYCYRHGSGEQ